MTALRVPLAVMFVVNDSVSWRFGVLIVTAATDFADGMLARWVGGSRWGAVLDPVCDKLFMVTAFGVVLVSGVLGPVEIVGVLLRDIVAAFAFLGTVMRGRPTTLPARAGGKAVTICQLLTLIAFVAGSDLVRPLAWAAAAISVYAIADYSRAALK